jgi:hypothetical protein
MVFTFDFSGQLSQEQDSPKVIGFQNLLSVLGVLHMLDRYAATELHT